jgi:DNA-directed RNA polymerase subunit F
MTQDEIIEMARQAGVRDDEHIFEFSQYKYLERFAKLVAEKEREACWDIVGIALLGSDRELTKRVANAIRARGQA